MIINEVSFYFLVGLLSGISAKNTYTKYEFKYLIDPGNLDCFYQHAVKDAVFHSSIQVLKGDDINFYIIDANNSIVFNKQRDTQAYHQVEKTPDDGVYQICIDNQYSLFTSKLVYLYILTFHTDTLMQSIQENQALNETANSVQQSSDRIFLKLIDMTSHQALARFRQSRDDYVIEANNSLVFYWSLSQSIFIVLCGIFQVYFIKRLFNVSLNKKKIYN